MNPFLRRPMRAAGSAPSGGGGQMSPQQLNQIQRQAVLSQSLEMIQLVQSITLNPTQNNVYSVQPRYVGLIKKFYVEVIATLTNGATATATLTDTAIPNLLSNVQLIDLSNNVRINTTGLHLALLASAKRRHQFGATSDFNQVSTNNRSQMTNVPPASWPIFTAPPTIAANAAGTVRGVFEVPLAYSDDDLRGAIYANVVNATMNLQLTFNLNSMVAANVDQTLAVYNGSAGTFTSVTVNVYQVYLDQLPIANGRVVLPTLDLSTVYELKNTVFTGMTAGIDFPIPYTNFRDFMSTFVIYNNAGAASSSGRAFGSDMNYLTIQSANFTNIIKYGPLTNQLINRGIEMSDTPAGIYYFSHRKKPISTTQYGNIELVLNPSTAGAAAYASVYWEDMALLNTLTQAGSLAAGG